MSRKVGLGISLVLISLIMLAIPIKAKDSSYKVKEYNKNNSNLQIIEEFKMPQLNRTRRVWIYLPPNYHQTDKKYSVLYMNDGQNLFDRSGKYGGWKVDKTLDKLVNQNKTTGVIAVGIDNGGTGKLRGQEYDYVCALDLIEYPSLGLTPQGDKYVDFLINTLKPYIDSHYRTLPGREHTGIAGSSAGAAISLYAGFDHPEVFSKVAAFSLVDRYPPIAFRNKIKLKPEYKMRIYIDIGTKEYGGGRPELVDNVKDFRKLLKEMGFKDQELKVVIDKGGGHKEKDWADRFPPAFLWLFTEEDVSFKQYLSEVKVY